MKAPSVRSAEAAPSLRHGDRMTQPEFHRRYEAHPEDVKMELVGGIVHVASPLKRKHGTTAPKLGGALCTYEAFTPGVEMASDMTVILGGSSEPQPDHLLRILTEYGGQSRYEDDCLTGPPELIAEISDSTRRIDLKDKKRDYLAAGVQEYVVADVDRQELHWFHFPSKRKLKADRQGIVKSLVFPGFWLDAPALFARDARKVLAAIHAGTASAEHAAFVRQLDRRR